MQKTIIVSLGFLLCLGVATSASAGDFDGSKPLLCAPGDARQCTVDAGCEHVSVDAINIPRFITVDAKKKTLTGIDADGENESTKIKSVELNGGKTILQGSENNRGWSIVINPETGRMAASVLDEQTGFIVFGACTVR